MALACRITTENIHLFHRVGGFPWVPTEMIGPDKRCFISYKYNCAYLANLKTCKLPNFLHHQTT